MVFACAGWPTAPFRMNVSPVSATIERPFDRPAGTNYRYRQPRQFGSPSGEKGGYRPESAHASSAGKLPNQRAGLLPWIVNWTVCS